MKSNTHTGRLARGTSLQLIIHSVQANDESLYQCSVAAFTRGAFSRPLLGDPIRLIVNSPPKIRRKNVDSHHNSNENKNASGNIDAPHEAIEEEYLPEGGTFHVECIADGAPTPKDDKVISTNRTLHIEHVSVTDRGIYECVAVNSEGRDSLRKWLRFSRDVQIDYAPSNKTVAENSSVFWHCNAKGYPSDITYSWFHNDTPIKASAVGLRAVVQGGDLGIRTVQRSDAGRYRCDASNGLTKAVSATAFLDVQYIPQASSTNSEVYLLGKGLGGSLQCDFDANPPISFVVWTHNGALLPNADGTRLNLDEVKDEHSGIYACQAFNSIGSSRAFEIHVAIAEPPRFSSSPPPAIFAKLNSLVEVNCDGYGDPPPVQYWLRNRSVMLWWYCIPFKYFRIFQKKIESSKILLHSVSHNDFGVYECFLSNPVATISTQMFLYVQNTYPQAVSELTANCGMDSEQVEVHWKAGYDSGSEQHFRLFYREENEKNWHSTNSTDLNHTVVHHLSPFILHHLLVESSNIFGAINSSAITQTVCSRLNPPRNLRLNSANSLEWDMVDGAMAYRVQYRNSDDEMFSELLDTKETSVSLHDYVASTSSSRISSPSSNAPTSKSSSSWIDVRVSSLRPPNITSIPSNPFRFHVTKANTGLTLLIGIFGTILMVLLLLVLLWAVRRRFAKHRNARLKRINERYGFQSEKHVAAKQGKTLARRSMKAERKS
ncbi:unnamed protein product [Anisakis simplex]|uniref:Protein turtle n=1 Tax=Anisakis simplex TaxID=6269 RepID=A0A158PMQ3_ANISI|nr:unnamed protein product [Anisakis simplex]